MNRLLRAALAAALLVPLVPTTGCDKKDSTAGQANLTVPDVPPVSRDQGKGMPGSKGGGAAQPK